MRTSILPRCRHNRCLGAGIDCASVQAQLRSDFSRDFGRACVLIQSGIRRATISAWRLRFEMCAEFLAKRMRRKHNARMRFEKMYFGGADYAKTEGFSSAAEEFWGCSCASSSDSCKIFCSLSLSCFFLILTLSDSANCFFLISIAFS